MDIIDFISTALKDKKDKKIARQFIEKVKKNDPKALLQWFHSLKYNGVSLEDCEKIIKNQKNIIHNAEVSVKSNY